MGIFHRRKDITAGANAIKGTVTATKTLYWLTVNKNALRENNADSSHPHMVYFKYSVNGREYEGKSYMSWKIPEFAAGQEIKVYVDKNDPRKYVLNN